jgi:5-methylcytosine-specific restriction endonuclease McrA
MSNSKQCRNPDCKQVNPQPLSEFYKLKLSPDGLNSRCKTCIKLAANNYYHRLDPEKTREKGRRYRAAHPEKVKEQRRRYRVANPEKVKERRIRYKENNRDKIRELNRLHRKANPEKIKAQAQRRKERISSGGNYTKREWWALCDYYGNKCLACGECKALTADHIVPVSKGGKNDLSNIQPLCGQCNSKKGGKTIDYRPTVPRWAE